MFFVAPKEIEARGERAQLVYQRALKDGAVNVQRARILLIGQDRAGKTSLKKSLVGLPFDPKENSTEGIEVDPSIFQVDAQEVKNWQPIDKSERGLLGCSKDVAQMVVKKLFNPGGHILVQEGKEGSETDDSDQLENKNDNNGTTVDDTDGEKRDDSSVNQVCFQLNPGFCTVLKSSIACNRKKVSGLLSLNLVSNSTTQVKPWPGAWFETGSLTLFWPPGEKQLPRVRWV